MTDARQNKGYLHGYTREEQDRLYEQARFLERKIYAGVDFQGGTKIIEVGCGVGAQTQILLERFPNATIEAVDASADQLARAKERLKDAIVAKRVNLTQADAAKLPFPDDYFHGAFVCFLLEHVPKPVDVLSEIRRVLKPGATVVCTEVMNASFFVHPYSPATLKYWFAFNDHQWNLGGDPFVGAKLGNYLIAAGYQNMATEPLVFHYDNRRPKLRAQLIDYWTRLFLSGAPELLKANHVTAETVAQMKAELAKLKHDPDAVFFDMLIQAKGQVF